MASLNIRNFPPELLKALKVEAARRGVTLREWVIGELGGHLRSLARTDEGFARMLAEPTMTARVIGNKGGK